MKRGTERDHPLLLAYAYFLEHDKGVGYETENTYMCAARKIMTALEQRGVIILDQLQHAHHSVKHAYEHGGLKRAMGGVAKVAPYEINAFELFLSRGYPKAQRGYDAQVLNLRRALSYLDRPAWQVHLAPLVFESSGGFRLRKLRTKEQKEAVKFINEVGGCVDCGRSPMEKGVIRERRLNRRTADTSRYLAVTCGETSTEGNRCQRGWRATTGREDVKDSLLEHNPDFVPNSRR